MAEESILVSGKLSIQAARDPDDNKFLAAVMEADADYLVSGDRDLLDLGSYRGVNIIKPASFLALLRA